MSQRAKKVGRGFTAGLILCSVLIFAQQVVENHEKPSAKNAGRVLALREIWRISDEGAKFYFKRPAGLWTAADGSFFLVDEAEVLKFSAEGRFLRNLFKPGQGPGEFTSDVPGFTIRAGELVLYDFMARKIVILDLDGNLLRQFRIEAGPYGGFYGVFQDRFIFSQEIFPSLAERKPGRQSMPVEIRSIGADGTSEKTHGLFLKDIVIRGNGFTTWTAYSAVQDGTRGRIYVAATREYGVEVIDLAAATTTAIWKRKYKSIPYRERGWEENFYKTNDVPRIKIEQDIRGLFLAGDALWVKTSTSDPKKGDLFDVFGPEGRFLDSFFLGAGRSLLRISGDEVYVIEKAPDDNLVLVKYRIIEEGR